MQQHENTPDRQMFHLSSIATYAAAAFVFLLAMVYVILLLTEGKTNMLVMLTQGNMVVAWAVSAVAKIIIQILLFGVVAALPCSSWARACGYGARFILIIGSILVLNGLSAWSLLPLNASGAAIGAIWMIVVSWRIKGATRVIGLPLALLEIVFSFHVEWSQGLFGLVSTLLYLIWLLLIARALHHYGRPEPPAPKEDPPGLEWSSLKWSSFE